MRKFMIAVCLALFAVSAFAQSTDQLWNELMEGNARFVAGSLEYPALRQLRNVTAGGQAPQTAILSCSDSRVPVELIFDRTLGELFVVRVAGNVDNTFNVASLEYAASKGWTRLIVVMGHSDCGAVAASLPKPEVGKPTPSLYELILRIRQSFTAPTPTLREATIMNINYTAAVLGKNPLLKNIPIVKAYYDAATGKVEKVP